jgi:hypothetical protein
VASPSGDKRDQLRTAAAGQVQRWEDELSSQLDQLWERQEGVILARLQGTKARKGTRHWMPRPPVTEVKALDESYIVDLARWVLEAAAAARQVFTGLFQAVVERLASTLGQVRSAVTSGGPTQAPTASSSSSSSSSAFGSPDPTSAGPPPAADTAPVRTDPAAADSPATARTAPDTATADAPDALDAGTSPVDDAQAQKLVAQRADAVAQGVQDAAAEVQKVITDGDAAGKPMDAIADDVRKTYATRKDGWTRQIVQTNVVGAMNQASLLAATSFGVNRKQWLSSHDSRVRETHREADGQIVALGDDFHLGGFGGHPAAALAYPGDPSGPADEWMNCRCTLLFPMPALSAAPYVAPTGYGSGSQSSADQAASAAA